MASVLALDSGTVDGTEQALRRLVDQDAIGQLIRADGRFAVLGSEGGVPRLDWVSEVERLLADPAALESVEQFARGLWQRGVRRVIWSGMGGSVNTVRVLTELGFCRPGGDGIAVHPLDSTDPAALNELLRDLGATGTSAGQLQALFAGTQMVAVSIGITSAEPVSHAAWFLDLLATAGLAPAEHLTVLTVDGSHLGRFAAGHGLPVRPVHLAGRTGIPGRMSAPTTLVFLLPVALHFAGSGGGQLRAVLREAWRRYDLAGARADPPASSYVRLAAALCAAGHDGRCGLVLSTVEPRPELLAWIEQLLEQSLGKGGKGIVVFTDQSLDDRPAARALRLTVPYPVQADPVLRLAELAAMFLGWQLCTALYGYLHEICVVDEPAVERYKAHARRLLADPEADPLAGLDATPWRHRVIEPGSPQYPDRVRGLAGELRRVAAEQGGYLDITVNGRSPGVRSATIQHWAGVIAGQTLGIPVKLRQAPAAYHISEQSEMDGPQRMVSIRTVSRSHQPARVGTYPDRFLVAAAVASWLAMNEVGRCCFLVLVDEASAVDGVLADLAAAIEQRRV